MIQIVSAKTFYHNDPGLYYHIQDGKFFPTKWLAIDHGHGIGLTNTQVLSKT